jgi:hypothetical protein
MEMKLRLCSTEEDNGEQFYIYAYVDDDGSIVYRDSEQDFYDVRLSQAVSAALSVLDKPDFNYIRRVNAGPHRGKWWLGVRVLCVSHEGVPEVPIGA